MNAENNQGVIQTRKEIKSSLLKIVDILLEEDHENRRERTMGDWLEFFASNSMFEIIWAYTKADKPTGFFKIGVPVILDIITGITCTSLLSQSNIHQSLVMLLNSISLSLQHESQYFNWEEEILELINGISLKAYNEPYLISLFFSNVRKCSTKKSERGEYIPLKIVLFLFKALKTIGAHNKDYALRVFYVLKLILRTNSKPLDEYIMNESDLIETIITHLNSFYHSLPKIIPKKSLLPHLPSKLTLKKLPNKFSKKEELKLGVPIQINKISKVNKSASKALKLK